MQKTALIGGKVWTAGFVAPRRLDVMVEGEHFIDVARAGELDTEGAEVIDLAGRLLLPGFQDAHIHPIAGGNDLSQCNLLGLSTREDILQAIENYSSANPELEWVLGGGWLLRAFAEPPTAKLLDGLVGNRKASLQAHSRHSIWASSAALAAAGIDRSTPDPTDGRIERDADGNPTGLLHEGAMSLLTPVMPQGSDESRADHMLAAQRELLRFGITSVQDALVGEGLGLADFHGAYMQLLEQDALDLRVTTALWWDAARGIEQIAELLERRRRLEQAAPKSRIIADTVKIMVDAADLILMPRDALIEATVALDSAGFTVHYHSYGESSTKNVLDAVEAARNANPASRARHHIAHLMVVEAGDFARFGTLGVTANIQGFWGNLPVLHSMLRPSQLSHDPHRREYAFARLLTAGARLAAGSDWPVSSANPLDAVKVTTQRATRGDEAAGEPDELDRLDTATILEAYTAGSAYVNGRADTTGRIAAGYLADFVVLSDDIFAATQHGGGEDHAWPSVDQTWVGGQRLI